MPSRFLVEVPHEASTVACAHAVVALLKSGSHFITHADWGCMDGEHKAWVIVEVESKEEARGLVPPAFRSLTKVVQLNSFTLDQMEGILRQHQG